MASASAIRAGAAYVELSLEKSKFVQGLRGAQQTLASSARKMTAVGTAIAGAGLALGGGLFAAVKTFASAGDELNKMSSRTGIAVESLSELKHGLQLSDSSLQAFEKSIIAMNKAMLSADEDSLNAKRAMQELGVSLDDLETKTPEQRFLKLVEALSGIEDEGRRAALATRVFSRGGADLLPFINAGTEGIAKMREEARELGLTLSTDDANAAALLSDSFTKVQSAAKAIIIAIGRPLADVTTRVAEFASKFAGSISKFISNNPGLIKTVATIAAAAIGIGGALIAIGGALGIASFAIGGLITAFSTAITVIGAVGSVLAVIISPIGLIVAGVIALGGWLIYASGAWDALKNGAISAWRSIEPIVSAIINAIKAGDLKAAWSAAMNGLKIIALEAGAFLIEKWAAVLRAYVQPTASNLLAIARMFLTFAQQVVAIMLSMWTTLAAFIRPYEDAVIGAINRMLRGFAKFASKAIQLMRPLINLLIDGLVGSIGEVIQKINTMLSAIDASLKAFGGEGIATRIGFDGDALRSQAKEAVDAAQEAVNSKLANIKVGRASDAVTSTLQGVAAGVLAADAGVDALEAALNSFVAEQSALPESMREQAEQLRNQLTAAKQAAEQQQQTEAEKNEKSDSIAKARDAVSSAGSFSARIAAATAFGGGSVEERMLVEQQRANEKADRREETNRKIADNTAEVAARLRNTPPAVTK